MPVTWEAYQAATDLDEVEQAAWSLRQQAQQAADQQLAADLQVASRLYLVHGELDFGSPQLAGQYLQALLNDPDALADCSPDWQALTQQVAARVHLHFGDYAGAAWRGEHAAALLAPSYPQGAVAIPLLLVEAADAALRAGAAEWAVELAVRALGYLQQQPLVLDLPGGPEARRQASNTLQRILERELPPQPRRRWRWRGR